MAWDSPSFDLPIQIDAPENQHTTIARDILGKPTAITRGSIARTYGYNADQELSSATEPETGETLMGYDGAGNLAWSASGLPAGTDCSSDGNTTAINARKAARTYDARNRISTLVFPDVNGNQGWTYTPDGLPATVTTFNDGGTTSVVNTYLYNKRRLLTGESQAQTGNPDTWSVGYGYSTTGAPASLTYPTGLTLTFSPNALGQPTLLAGATQTFASGISYWPNGALKQFTYGNGIVHTLAQNARGLPDRSRDADGATSVHDDSYANDQVGNVLAISDGVAGNRGDRDMAYDGLNRLTSTVSPMFGTATYAYDVQDNLSHVAVTGGSQIRDQGYVYTNNQLTNIIEGGASVVGLGYDVQGNLSNKNGVLYGFDYGNRLRSGGPETYRYDAYGRRARSINSTGGIVYSLYGQGGQLLWQRDQRTNQRRNYVYLQGSLLAEHRRAIGNEAATIIYQHTDALGTPVATTNSAKTVLQRSEYEPYGYLLNRPMEDGPGYTGHVTDAATGLVYMQQRYYDPMVGRFLSVDPVMAISDPIGYFGRYHYANSNPYKFTDPDGRGWITKAIKLIVHGGNIAQTFAGVVSDAKTVMNPNASTADRVLAGLSIASEGLPVSIGDAKDAAKGIKRIAEAVETDKFGNAISREARSIQDQMTFDAAKNGEGIVKIDSLGDPKFAGMQKMELRVESAQGATSNVHYVRDPRTGETMDFKFKEHSTDRILEHEK